MSTSIRPVPRGDEPDDDDLDRVFRALADRTRRGILDRLSEGRPATITELAAPFDMSLPAVSKHVRVLEAAGLVTRDVRGRVHHCSLRPEPLDDAVAWIRDTRTMWEGKLDRLATLLEEE